MRDVGRNGPDWALSVLGGVVSSVLSSSVGLYRLQCEWLVLDWMVLVGSVVVMMKCVRKH